jgi:hypothetical protein
VPEQTPTQRKATARKAAATRRRNAAARSRSARKAAETRAQAELNTLQVVQAQAERAVLIPVGAALTARDEVIEAVKPYTASRESAEREVTKLLRRFERRGNTARKKAVREVKRTRTKAERQLRQRRNQVTRIVKRNRREAGRQVKVGRREAENLVNSVSDQVTSLA